MFLCCDGLSFKTLQLSEKLQDTENEAMSKIVELEKQLMQRNKELDVVRVSGMMTATPTGTAGNGLQPRLVGHRVHSCWRNECIHTVDGLEPFQRRYSE